MAKSKSTLSAEALRPYVQRAMTDPDLRDDLLAAFVAARGLYGQLARKPGIKYKAEKISDKGFQKDLQGLVDELAVASDRIQGKTKRKAHKTRNRVIMLTGVTLGVLYNPWTGQSTRDWIMDRVAGGNGTGLEELEAELEAEAELGRQASNGAEPKESRAQRDPRPRGSRLRSLSASEPSRARRGRARSSPRCRRPASSTAPGAGSVVEPPGRLGT